MVKKIGLAGTIIGGLLAAIGGILAFVGSANEDIEGIINMAVLSRVGAIILFVCTLVVLAVAFMTAGSKKGGAVARMIFGIAAFVGQFLIDPYTSLAAMTKAALYGDPDTVVAMGGAGFLIITISGIVLLIMGIVGIVSKKNQAQMPTQQ